MKKLLIGIFVGILVAYITIWFNRVQRKYACNHCDLGVCEQNVKEVAKVFGETVENWPYGDSVPTFITDLLSVYTCNAQTLKCGYVPIGKLVIQKDNLSNI